ncbi:hypothetical protein [Nocardia suismassiliense]|uniref:hypothetical protein n=1 Tax=Nocardia suismassiliense TaxID=2077092 RepID=UPI000D1E198C|nr:hypothetical protein [Nocardia suismassiliense]
MQTPTRLQTLLLKGIQNLAHDTWIKTSHSVAAGHATPPPEVVEHIAMNHRSLTELEDLASLVGCPHSWLNYARKAGERGEPWSPERPFQSPDKAPRLALIAALGEKIHSLQDTAGVLAAHTLRQHTLDSDEQANFGAVMGVRWQRLGAVAHELGLTDRERDQVWSRHGSRHWANVVAQECSRHSDEELSNRFNAVAHANFSMEATPLMVMLQSGTSLEHITTQMPHSAEKMVELVDVALDAIPREPEAARLNEAVAAATPSEHAATEPPHNESAWGGTEPEVIARVADYGTDP